MGDYTVCKSGEHKARALSAALSTLKNGSQFAEVIFSLIEGGEITWAGWFGDDQKKNTWTIEALRHCGWRGDDLTDLTGIDRNLVMLVIENDSKDGHTRSKVRYVNRIGTSAQHKNRMSPMEAKQLADKLKSLCQSVSGAPKFRTQSTKPETYISHASSKHRVIHVGSQASLPNPFEDGNPEWHGEDNMPF